MRHGGEDEVCTHGNAEHTAGEWSDREPTVADDKLLGAAVGDIQAPDGAFASAMPEAAMAWCPAARVLPLAQIAHYLRSIEKV